jgi:catalase
MTCDLSLLLIIPPKRSAPTDAAKPLLDKAGVVPDDGITALGDAFINAAKKRYWDRESSLRSLA